MRKRHSQKFQYASGGIAVGSDNIFIKENERLNVVFTKIICPVRSSIPFLRENSFKESSMNSASGIWEKDAQRFNT
jgi:hypothetical protein